MATITINNLQTKLNDSATEILGMLDATAIETLGLATGVSVTQVIITNKSAVDVYLKFWDSGSSPTISTGSWSLEPTMILPAVAGETADKGKLAGSSTTLSVDVLIFTK